MLNDTETFDRLCKLSGKMGGIKYDAGRAKSMLSDLREWVGKGKSRKTLAMLSLINGVEERLTAIIKDAA